MRTQGTQGPETFDDRMNGILQHYRRDIPRMPQEPPLGPPQPDPGNAYASNTSPYPNPFLDIGKYIPKAPSSRPEPNDALKFWQHPSPKVIPIREGGMDGLFGVPPQHLQQMAGNAIPYDQFKNARMNRAYNNILNTTPQQNAQQETQDVLSRALGVTGTVLPFTPSGANK